MGCGLSLADDAKLPHSSYFPFWAHYAVYAPPRGFQSLFYVDMSCKHANFPACGTHPCAAALVLHRHCAPRKLPCAVLADKGRPRCAVLPKITQPWEMNEELFFFTAGAVFTYGQSTHSRLWYVISLCVFFVFTYSLIARRALRSGIHKSEVFRPGEAIAGVLFLLCEHFFAWTRAKTGYPVVEKILLVLGLSGYILSMLSVFEFCKYLTKEKTFLRTGVHSYIRHPFHLGVCVFSLGISVYLVGYVSAVFILIYMFTKVRERILEEEQAYLRSDPSYAEHRKRTFSGFFT